MLKLLRLWELIIRELIKIKLNAYLYLYKHGIQHQNIVPCTPQQNGVVERKNRTLVEIIKCMLYSKWFHKCLCVEAISYANVKNPCQPSSLFR